MSERAAIVEDEYLSSSKIGALESPEKKHTAHANAQGVIGSDHIIDTAKISPFPRHAENHPHHADSCQKKEGKAEKTKDS